MTDPTSDIVKHQKGTGFFSALLIASALIASGWIMKSGSDMQDNVFKKPLPDDITISVGPAFALDCSTFPGGELTVMVEVGDVVQSYNCMTVPLSE